MVERECARARVCVYTMKYLTDTRKKARFFFSLLVPSSLSIIARSRSSSVCVCNTHRNRPSPYDSDDV